MKESADLIYNLVVLWVATGIRPEDVWKEMDRRERLLGIAEKVPKKLLDEAARRKIVVLEGRWAQTALISAAETPRSCQAPHPPHRRRMDIHRPCR